MSSLQISKIALFVFNYENYAMNSTQIKENLCAFSGSELLMWKKKKSQWIIFFP